MSVRFFSVRKAKQQQPLTLILKHTSTIFSLSDHYILSWEWKFIDDQVQTNYHGRPIVL